MCLGSTAAVFAQGNGQLTDEKSRVSYAIGMSMGHTLQRQGVDIDPELTARALKDVLTSNTTLLTPDEVQTTLTKFQQEFRIKQQAKMEEEKQNGEAYLAANKNNPGVVTLPDGLQYQVLTTGTGAMPTANDVVTVNYKGSLIDGTEFDSSYKRGQPAQFQVGGVIPGWTEALQKMKVGSKWKLFIPYNLAYGGAGHPPVIPPNSTLVFEVELMDAKSPTPPPQAPPVAPLTSDIIKVPSAEELKKGAKIEVIKPEDAAKAQQGLK